MKRIIFFVIVFFFVGCNDETYLYGDKKFYAENEQRSKYFRVERKSVDYLTPATVLSLRTGVSINDIPDALPELCLVFDWANENRFYYIFQDSESAMKFDSFGIENLNKGKPVDAFIAIYNPDDVSILFFPLIKEKWTEQRLENGWCK